jgi:hypothetical protein
MLRPIFLKVFHRLFPHASLRSRDKQYKSTQIKQSMKMSTLKSKIQTADDVDSLKELASSDDGYSSDHGDEDNALYGVRGPRVVIKGNDGSTDLEGMASSAAMGGILVRSETFVQVTTAR